MSIRMPILDGWLLLSLTLCVNFVVKLRKVKQLVLHSLARLLVVLGVVPDEGPVLVKVPHEVIIIIELAKCDNRVGPGNQISRWPVALHKIKVYRLTVKNNCFLFSPWATPALCPWTRCLSGRGAGTRLSGCPDTRRRSRCARWRCPPSCPLCTRHASSGLTSDTERWRWCRGWAVNSVLEETRN